jgi:uncharacterized protein YbjT (DUF2867 family)
MQAWVAGATGLVGRALVTELSGRPRFESVLALVRHEKGRNGPRVEERVVAFERLDRDLGGRRVTHVFCCLGTTMKKAGSESGFRIVDYEYPLALGRAALAAGAKKFLVVTAVGADPESRIFYNRVKGELERDLAALGLPELHVFRPSLILGERAERRVGERVAIGVAKPLGALMLGSLRRYRPIDATVVARAMAVVAENASVLPPVSIYESNRLAELGGSAR